MAIIRLRSVPFNGARDGFVPNLQPELVLAQSLYSDAPRAPKPKRSRFGLGWEVADASAIRQTKTNTNSSFPWTKDSGKVSWQVATKYYAILASQKDCGRGFAWVIVGDRRRVSLSSRRDEN